MEIPKIKFQASVDRWGTLQTHELFWAMQPAGQKKDGLNWVVGWKTKYNSVLDA